MNITIRQATELDQPAILRIYNYEVMHNTATFDTQERTLPAQQVWFAAHGQRHPVLVAVHHGEVLGWASLSPWSERKAYDHSCELSVYIDVPYRGKGIGQLLMKSILEAGKIANMRTIISKITSENEGSIHIHQKFGFIHVGELKAVGEKFDRILDVTIMQLILK
ncbi:MAG: hypothetical protein RIQ89_1342 [Bacteroidota bacterium]|jgi:L-amino acid N-acyltransferase